MTEELKPCPFCGGRAEWFCVGSDDYFVDCGSCNPSSDYGSPERIRAKWNTRAPVPVPDEVREMYWAWDEVSQAVLDDGGDPVTSREVCNAIVTTVRAYSGDKGAKELEGGE